jgi:hypothetical protein
MILGIVGSEAAKFTPETEALAKAEIRILLASADGACSGECHLGGIDIWTHEIADNLGIPFIPCPPKTRNWDGYKKRNIKIAEISNRVACITVATLPPGFKEGGWERYCYHCGTDSHIKSGGCWTVKYARNKLGKPGEIIVI